MRLPRFSMLQLLLAAALCALVLGLLTASWRSSFYAQILSVRFSPDGKHLVAKYTNGSMRIWRLDSGNAKLAVDFPSKQVWAYEFSAPHFTDNHTLVDLQTTNAASGSATRLRTIDVRTGTTSTPLPFPTGTFYTGLFAASSNVVAVVNWQAGTIDTYSAADGKFISRSAVRPIGLEGSISADGKHLVVLDQNGNVALFDVASGRLVMTNAMPMVAVAKLSPTDQQIALATFQPISGKPYIQFLGMNGSPQPGRIDPDLATVSWMSFSGDGSKLAVADFEALELYDLASQRLLKRIALTRTHTRLDSFWGNMSFMPFSVGSNQIAMSPDATTVASIRGGQLVLWDVNSGRPREVIVATHRMLQIVIFTVCFCLWAAAWGIVAKRQRRNDPLPPPRKTSLAAYMPPGRAAAPPVMTIKSVVGTFVWLGMTVAFAVILLSWDSLSVSPFAVVGRSVLWAIALPLAIVAVVVIYVIATTWLFGPLHFQLKQLKQNTRQIASERNYKYLSGWFVGPSSLQDDFRDEYEAIAEGLGRFYGRPIARRKIQVMGLESAADYDRLFGRQMPVAGAFVPNQRPPLAAVCEELAVSHLQAPLDQFRSAIALLLVHQQVGGFLAAWPATTLSILLGRSSEYGHNLAASLRRMRVRLAREPGYDPKELLDLSSNELGNLRLKSESAEGFYPTVEALDLYSTLAEFLRGEEADEARSAKVVAWLAQARPADDPRKTFEQHVGLSAENLLAEWRVWIMSRPLIESLPPSPPKRVAISRVVNRLRLDQEATTAERSRMVRLLGHSGHIFGAGVLMELLADSACRFRGDVIWSLESISGLALGDDSTAWQSWWNEQAIAHRQPEPLEAIVLEATQEAAAHNESLTASPQPPKPSGKAPTELKICWGMMIIGGFIALVFPISVLFFTGPVVWPALYYSLFVGVAAIASGAARETLGLQKTATLQTINIIACDPVNLLLGLLAKQLLKRARAREYLLQAGGGRP